MKNRYFLFLLVILAGCSKTVPPLGTLKSEAMRMVSLAQTNQYEEFADLIYPTVIKMAGGRYEFIERARQVNRGLVERDVKMLAIEVGEPGDAVVNDGKIFAIVPTVTKIDTPAAAITSSGYLLAISTDNGATWKFLEGSGLTAATTYVLVPDLPSGLKFPKDESPVVVKKPKPEPRESPGLITAPSSSTLQIRTIEVADAMVSGRAHEFAAALYPPVVASFGGPEKFAAIFLNVMHTADERALRKMSADVAEPGEFASEGGRMFAVVPVTIKAETSKRITTRQLTFLAISEDGGANWAFIVGITPKMAGQLRTLRLPGSLKIPEQVPDRITDK